MTTIVILYDSNREILEYHVIKNNIDIKIFSDTICTINGIVIINIPIFLILFMMMKNVHAQI